MLWAALPMPALLLDKAGHITAANPAAEVFLNNSQRMLHGSALKDRILFAPDPEQAVARALMEGASLCVNDLDVAVRGQARALAMLHIAPLGDGQQMIMLLSPRELGGHGADASVRSVIGMAQMLAHEIKNPLAGISGAAQLLAMGLSSHDDLELTGLIVDEARRIARLLEQVDQFGNRLPPECCAVNLHHVLDHARQSAQIGFAAHMKIVAEYDPSLPWAWADEDRLMQVFLNLIKNAAEAGGDTIWLRTSYDAALRRHDRLLPLQVKISDNGKGLPPEIADHIFDPFISGKENGTGLGLALVAKIISDHGGWVRAEMAGGRTVFSLSLPMASEQGSKQGGI